MPSFAQSVEKIIASGYYYSGLVCNGSINPTERNIEPTSDFLSIKYQLLQIDIAIDELFGNIAHYAYNPDIGPATVRVEVKENPLRLLSPLSTTVCSMTRLQLRTPTQRFRRRSAKSADSEYILLKKSMDEITYEYKDGQNILTIKKNI